MYSGRLVFSQVMEHLPMKTFRRCVQRYHGNRHIQSFTCLDQFLCMVFAQLTFRESLRDIEVCLRAHQDKLYHMGIRGGMSRNTLANANQRRDWRIYAEFAQAMIRIARPPASCITFPPIHAFAAQNTGFSDRNSVWLKFTASENKPHAIFLNLVQSRTESFVKRM